MNAYAASFCAGCLAAVLVSGLSVSADFVAAAEPPITALAFAPDGNTLVAASQAGVRLYTWPELKPSGTVPCRLQCVHDVRFSHDGTRLAVAGGTPAHHGSVEIFDWPRQQQVAEILQHRDVVFSVCWLNQDQQLGLASLDGTATVVSAVEPEAANDGRLLVRYEGHSRSVIGIDVLVGAEKQSSRIITAAADHTIQVWSIQNTRSARVLNNHTGPVTSICIRPQLRPEDRTVLASTSEDKTVRFWQPDIGRLLRFVRLPSVAQTAIWNHDGNLLLVACRDGYCRRINAETAMIVNEQLIEDCWLISMAMHPLERACVIGTADGKLHHVTESGQ